eukprot:NODE_8431_length_551_cov_1.365566_g8408_i0.p2 GENE.NODE_8431_length_551_cov_1.365566_g8408_i0~~NODE_8431_length_551_cov_1.365566_g8408_i0.p2  ORF type:complete len:130 (+),score=12.71 NODE_8431_length_551_cov_1.365566_g8408_i0:146-535(+)
MCRKQFPAGFKQPVTGDPAANKNGVRPWQAISKGDCIFNRALFNDQSRYAQTKRILFDHCTTFSVTFNRHRLAPQSHPFNGNRTASGPQIPQNTPGKRRKGRKRLRTDFRFGDHAIMNECIIGQTRSHG